MKCLAVGLVGAAVGVALANVITATHIRNVLTRSYG